MKQPEKLYQYLDHMPLLFFLHPISLLSIYKIHFPIYVLHWELFYSHILLKKIDILKYIIIKWDIPLFLMVLNFSELKNLAYYFEIRSSLKFPIYTLYIQFVWSVSRSIGELFKKELHEFYVFTKIIPIGVGVIFSLPHKFFILNSVKVGQLLFLREC